MSRTLGGGLVKAEWFKRYGENERPERFDRIVQSWDTANKATELSDFSTAQFLDWFKTPFPGQNIFELYQRDAEKLKHQRVEYRTAAAETCWLTPARR